MTFNIIRLAKAKLKTAGKRYFDCVPKRGFRFRYPLKKLSNFDVPEPNTARFLAAKYKSKNGQMNCTEQLLLRSR